MAQVIWTTQARLDADDIGTYIASFSERQAKALFQRFFERTDQLEAFPEMGRIIPEIAKPQHRELLEGNYRIMYELLDADIVLIQRIIHQTRNFQP